MAALHRDSCTALQYNLQTLFARHLNHITMPKLTHAEAFELLVKQEHQAILLDVVEIANIPTRSQQIMSITLAGSTDGHLDPELRVTLRSVDYECPPLTPRVPVWNGNASAAKPVIAWVAQRMELGRLYGLAKHVLSELLDRCDNGKTIRYVWPAIGQLVTNCEGIQRSEQGRLDREAEKLTIFSRPSTMPAFNMAFRKAMAETNGLITASSMLDNTPGPDSSYGVLLDVGGTSFQWDGVTLQRM